MPTRDASTPRVVVNWPAELAATPMSTGSVDLPALSGPGSGAEGTVRASVAAALSHSASVRRAEADLSAAAVDVKIAYSGYQPSLDGSAGLGLEDAYDYRVTVSQPLFDWGHTGSQIGEAQAKRHASIAEYLDARDTAALEAAGAHIAVKRGEEMVAVAQENLTIYKRFTALAQERASGGVSDESEVQLAGVHQGEAESSLEQAQGELRDARSLYLLRVGVDGAGLADVQELPFEPTADLDTVVAESPAVTAARARAEAAQNAVKTQQTSLLPKLRAEAFVRGDEDSSDANTGLGLRITGPTLTGLSNFNRVEAARLQAEAAKWSAETVRRKVSLDLRQLLDQEPTLRSRIRILDGEIKKARALRDLYEDQFKIGQRRLADLVNVQVDIFRIERSLIEARYKILELQYKAASASGTLLTSLQLVPVGDAP